MAGDKNKLTEKQRQILEYLKQEILPISGICATSLWDAVSSDAIPWIAPRRPVWNPSSQISMALGFVASRLI